MTPLTASKIAFCVFLFGSFASNLALFKRIEANGHLSEKLGRPSVLDVNGQAKVLLLLLGVGDREVRTLLRGPLLRSRVLLLFAIAAAGLMSILSA